MTPRLLDEKAAAEYLSLPVASLRRLSSAVEQRFCKQADNPTISMRRL